MIDILIKKMWEERKKVPGFSLDISVECQRSRLVLFGASGSGKSLTLQLIAGLIKPDSGHIIINDVTLFDSEKKIDIPTQQRKVGYLFQDYALFPHMTVMQNVCFGLKSNAENKEKALNLLERFEIAALADHYPSQISGGQRQRTALARALSHSPMVLLLDEPFSALDPLLRIRLRKELHEMLKDYAGSIILITHDPEDVDSFAESLVVYRQGRTIAFIQDYQKKRLTFPNTCFFLSELLKNKDKD